MFFWNSYTFAVLILYNGLSSLKDKYAYNFPIIHDKDFVFGIELANIKNGR